jgi:hypothetical protein
MSYRENDVGGYDSGDHFYHTIVCVSKGESANRFMHQMFKVFFRYLKQDIIVAFDPDNLTSRNKY